ncbi:hypothetical protein F2Q69_00041942 [Brassica cretica]|uniref:Uncharacterized protein n=1 Tax=Brassica cretica TaxID=69181 RepID=A0A8S9NTQ9_BRACR|nr:hypothetical protein F2Q69_00041942 [Brassica cretica]
MIWLRYMGASIEEQTRMHGVGSYPLIDVRDRAREVWNLSGIPPPPAGFFQTSVFLNLHYLFWYSLNKNIDLEARSAFPWILWHIWKARNLFTFEKVRSSAVEILDKSIEEASVWLRVLLVGLITLMWKLLDGQRYHKESIMPQQKNVFKYNIRSSGGYGNLLVGCESYGEP